MVDSEGDLTPELQEFLKNLRDLGTIVLSLAVFAYLAGWISLITYMSQFGATWLRAEVPLSMVLERGIVPVALVAYIVWVVLNNIGASGGDEHPLRSLLRTALANLRKTDTEPTSFPFVAQAMLKVILIIATVVYLQYWPRALCALLTVVVVFVATVGVIKLLIQIRGRDLTWDLHSTDTLIDVLIAVLIVLPYWIGVFTGAGDLGPNSSLPIVKVAIPAIHAGSVEPRLLLHVDDKFYISQAQEGKGYPTVTVLSKEQIVYVQQVGDR